MIRACEKAKKMINGQVRKDMEKRQNMV